MKNKNFNVIITILIITILTSCTMGSDDAVKDSTHRDDTTTGKETSNVGEIQFDDNEMPIFEYGEFDGLRIASIKDTSAMGMVKMMQDSDFGYYEGNGYQFDLYDRPFELIQAFQNNDNVNIANIPCTMAADLYTKMNGDISIIAVNSLGSDFFVERLDRLLEIRDLKKNTIYFTDAGSNLDWVTRYILEKNEIDIRNDLYYCQESNYETIIQLMRQDRNAIGILPIHISMPASYEHREDIFRIALSHIGEWGNINPETWYVSNVTVVKNDYLRDNTGAVIDFLARYTKSVEFVSDNTNRAKAAELIDKYDIMTADMAYQSLPYSEIVFMIGNEMKDTVKYFYDKMYEFNPESLGGNLPDDSFYYLG